MSAAFDTDTTVQLEVGWDAAGPNDATFTWTDITAYWRGFNTTRGRGHERDTVTAGTLTQILSNDDRRFEPEYASGAYFPNVLLMKPVRARAVHNTVTYDLFRGFIEALPQAWPSMKDSTVSMTAVDGFKVLAWNEVTTAETQELSGARVGNLLDAAAWPTGARSLDTGDFQMAAFTPDCGKALGEIDRVVKTEDGLFFMDGAGDAVFHDNTHRSGASVQGTFNDDGTGLKYSSLTVGYDDFQIWNDVTVAALDVSPQAAEDATSVTKYGRRTLDVNDTLHVSAANALTVAQGLRDRYKDPGFRVSQITIEPRVDPVVLWPEVLGRELGDLMTVKRTPPGGGAQISVNVFVEGISHTVHAHTKTWTTTYLLSPQ